MVANTWWPANIDESHLRPAHVQPLRALVESWSDAESRANAYLEAMIGLLS